MHVLGRQVASDTTIRSLTGHSIFLICINLLKCNTGRKTLRHRFKGCCEGTYLDIVARLLPACNVEWLCQCPELSDKILDDGSQMED